MRHTAYKELFESKVTAHKEMQTKKAAFSQLHLSLNPMQQELDMTEFMSSLRNKSGIQVVLQSYHADYESNDSDNVKRDLRGAILILEKVGKDDWQQQGQTYEDTERICEELMAAVKYELNNSGKYLMKEGDLQSEKVGSVQGFHGTRMSFSIKQLSVPSLHYNPNLFA